MSFYMMRYGTLLHYTRYGSVCETASQDRVFSPGVLPLDVSTVEVPHISGLDLRREKRSLSPVCLRTTSSMSESCERW